GRRTARRFRIEDQYHRLAAAKKEVPSRNARDRLETENARVEPLRGCKIVAVETGVENSSDMHRPPRAAPGPGFSRSRIWESNTTSSLGFAGSSCCRRFNAFMPLITRKRANATITKSNTDCKNMP